MSKFNPDQYGQFDQFGQFGHFCQKMIILFAKNVNSLSKNDNFCQKLQKVGNFSQKIIETLVFVGRFNAFLKKKIQKLVNFVKN